MAFVLLSRRPLKIHVFALLRPKLFLSSPWPMPLRRVIDRDGFCVGLPSALADSYLYPLEPGGVFKLRLADRKKVDPANFFRSPD